MASPVVLLDFTSVSPTSGGVGVVATGVAKGLSDIGQPHRCLTTVELRAQWKHALASSPLSQVESVRVPLDTSSAWQGLLRRVLPDRWRRSGAVGAVRRVRALTIRRRTATAEVVWAPFHRVPAGRNAVVTIHDLRAFEDELASPMDQRILTNNIRTAAALVCSWPHPRDHLLRLFPEVRDKVFLVPLPVLHPGPLTHHVAPGPDERLNLLYPATNAPHKNHEVLIRALPLIPRAHLVCTGRQDKARLAKLQALAESLGIGHRITWTGYIGDDALEDEYRTAHMLVMPSRWEAASGPIYEAIARGLPFVASSIPPIQAQVAHMGVEAPLFEPDDPGAVALAVHQVISDYDSWSARWANLAPAVRARTWADTAREYLDVMRFAASAAGPAPRPASRRAP